MKTNLPQTKYLNPQEFDRLLTRLSDMSDIRPRDVTLIYLAITSGARAQELLNLRPKDLDLEQNIVRIRGLKKSNDREVSVHPWLMHRLNTLVLSPAQTTVFKIKYGRLNQIWKAFRPAPKTFHSIRHTFGVRMYQGTKDLLLTKDALGHRSVNNTMVYMATVRSIEDRQTIRDIALPIKETLPA